MLSFDQREGFIWFDGAPKPWRNCRIHVLTHGLHYASAVFEGERAYEGHVFRARDHGRRMALSAEIMGMTLPFEAAELDEAVLETLAANGLRDAYIRRIAWRGSEQLGVSAARATIHTAIACWEWPRYFSTDLQEQGLRLTWARYRRPSPVTAPCHAKAAGLYMINTIAKHEAEAAGFDDALMLDWRGYVAEATGANVFFIRGNELHSPRPDCFLDGITRQTVIELARQRGAAIFERHIEPCEIEGFEACFLTGSAAEVSPVMAVGDTAFVGAPLAATLTRDYGELVRSGQTTDQPMPGAQPFENVDSNRPRF